MENNSAEAVRALKAHVALNVRDFERSLDFYRKLWDLEPSKLRSGYAKFDIANPPLNLTLNQGSFNEKGALSHLGIQLNSTGDVLAIRDRWASSGLITRDEMQTDCCFALQDKAWVRDPDGNEWEAFVVLQDNLPEGSACGCTDELCAAPATEETVASASCCEPATSEQPTCCAPVSIGQ